MIVIQLDLVLLPDPNPIQKSDFDFKWVGIRNMKSEIQILYNSTWFSVSPT